MDRSERWRKIEGFAGYEVSDRGRVRRILASGNGRVMRTSPTLAGAPKVVLYQDRVARTVSVRRLVAKTFRLRGWCDECVVVVKDADPGNCALSNLRCTTRSDAICMGVAKRRAEAAQG